MAAVVLSVHLLIALALIVVVLLQRSEGGGLGIGGGGGGVMTGRGAATALAKVTWFLGAAFVATSLALTIFAARDAGQDSVIEAIEEPTGQTAPLEGNVPQLSNDLLAPVPTDDGPSTPPSADSPAAPPAAE